MDIVPWEINSQNELDLKSIVTFCSMGFMLEKDTYFKGIKVIQPSSQYTLDKHNKILEMKAGWEWYYKPQDRSFNDVVEEFSNIFESIVIESTKNKSILLPISGGLDSRTLFVPIRGRSDLTLASYEFEDGFNETSFGESLSQIYNIPFYSQKISRGYLWGKIEQVSKMNNCFSEFTHPRQAAVIESWKGLGSRILLGHFGDALFDSHLNSSDYSFDEQIAILVKKTQNAGGYELASDLWSFWELGGSFEEYITNRLNNLYGHINIDHPSARMRAFKSLYWVPRWTSINLSIFAEIGELVLPYYNDQMCKFICNISERYLMGRKIQIEYIKNQCREAAELPWQKYHPLNLYNYKWFHNPIYLPVRAYNKVKREINNSIFSIPKLVERNWELQFLGTSNFSKVENNILKNPYIYKLIPKSIILKYINKFKTNPNKYSHTISMILTLAFFCEQYYEE